MGLYKQCACDKPDVCSHPWWGKSRGVRKSLAKWARMPVPNKTEAKKIFAKFEASVLDGTWHQGPKVDNYVFRDLADDYLTIYFRPKGRNESSEKYKFEALKKKFGNIKPEDIKTLDIEKWVNELRAKGNSPATLRRYVARLKAILNWGFNRELVQAVGVRWGALDLEPEGQGRARRLEEGEEAKLKASADPWLKQLIEAALDTGLRAGALLGLTFAMFSPLKGTLTVPRKLLKNKRATHDLVIPLTQRMQAIIKFRMEGCPATAHIFGSSFGRRRKNFRWGWDKAREGAGVPKDKKGQFDLHWHDLRGEFATRLHEAGVPIETISYLLDHSTIEMTRRYVKIRTRSSKPAEAIEALQQFHGLFLKPADNQETVQ